MNAAFPELLLDNNLLRSSASRLAHNKCGGFFVRFNNLLVVFGGIDFNVKLEIIVC